MTFEVVPALVAGLAGTLAGHVVYGVVVALVYSWLS
jgi:hypothetical protein